MWAKWRSHVGLSVFKERILPFQSGHGLQRVKVFEEKLLGLMGKVDSPPHPAHCTSLLPPPLLFYWVPLPTALLSSELLPCALLHPTWGPRGQGGEACGPRSASLRIAFFSQAGRADVTPSAAGCDFCSSMLPGEASRPIGPRGRLGQGLFWMGIRLVTVVSSVHWPGQLSCFFSLFQVMWLPAEQTLGRFSPVYAASSF